jgi:inner membrane transporter RhtA
VQTERLPPLTYFLISAVFHYLGPALAVLLFARVEPIGVAWLRITTAAVVFALWRRPWRAVADPAKVPWRLLVGLGLLLAGMNTMFYLAIGRLPLATVGAIEFLGTLALAAAGVRTGRNLAALGLAVAGVAVLTGFQLAVPGGSTAWGFVFAFGNCLGFAGYVVLGHRAAQAGGSMPAIDRLALAMLVAAVAIIPIGLPAAVPALGHPLELLWGAGVGICSSVIPYVLDQLAMARLPRATFALMLAVLPATATVIGLVVLRQLPTPAELAGIALVTAGIAAHHAGPSR